jgi:hypothetical protein
MLVQIPGTHLVRDTNSMGLINRDSSARDEYFLKRKLAETQKEEINNIKSDIDILKSDLSEIKNLMFKLLEKGPNV